MTARTAVYGEHVDVIERHILPLRAALEAGNGQGTVTSQATIAGLSRSERTVLSEALFDEQVLSKLWLLDRLRASALARGTKILVLGGWCGVLPWLAHLTGRGAEARWESIDIDASVGSIGRRVFGGFVPNVSFVCDDIYDLDYHRLAQTQPLLIINTICEHLAAFSRWRSLLPDGVLTVLQSNNYRGCSDHVNCVDSSQELVDGARFGEVLFSGSLPLSLFTRYMVIGRT